MGAAGEPIGFSIGNSFITFTNIKQAFMTNKYFRHFVGFFLAMLGMSQSAAAADFKDFSVIVNNQTGTLLTSEEQAQGTAVEFGVAVAADGTVSRVAAGDASSVATISGNYHSDHGCTGLKVTVPVPGDVTILVGQCTYSSKDIVVKNSDGETVVTATPGQACWKNDRSNVTELTYKGGATTLTISGMDYCPYVAVKKYVAPAEFRNFSAIVNNQGGTLLTADEQVQGTAVNFGIAVAEDGTVSRVAADDMANAVAVISGKFHSEHGCTGLKAAVRVPGAVKITVGQCTYSSSAITVTDADGKTVATLTPSSPGCWKNSQANADELYYNGEATTLTITGMQYCPYIAVEAVENKLSDATISATFPFDLGTEGQTANFGDMDFYFLSSKVTHGENLILKDKNAHAGVNQTRFQPAVSNDEKGDGNAIRFMFRPYPGLTFTPTKVSLKATRYGTDGGNLDFAWVNPDGTTVSLASELKANRNNTEAPSNFSWDVTGATPAEGECGLQINLYALLDTKQVGFADITIEGTLSGEKQEIPILASFKANGTDYNVDDIFEIVGDDYVANIELYKADKMISKDNPLTDIVAKAGTVGDITYEGDDQKTTVTIPVTHNDMTMKWVANFVRKPFYTLTYIDTDGKTVIGTQQVEKDAEVGAFDIDGSKVTVAEGYAFRGWATANSGSTAVKYTAKSTFAENTNLYAYTTLIETASPTARFDYDLTQQNFDPADHEMLAFEGSGYWHDKQHGWAFQKGDKIKLELGGKGYIKLSLCQYSSAGDLKLYAPDGTTLLGTTANKVDSDGASATIQYDGAQGAGVLTLEIPAVSYIHSISIHNQAEDPYTMVEGSDIYVVKRGATDIESGKNLLSMLELANGFSGSDRKIIFLPNGTYDLEETVLTTISRNNLSLIGESMDGVIIKNAPDISVEGIGTTATLLNTSTGLYMQDLTLQNALDYYGAVRNGQAGGRAVCLQDKGKQTICKNVKMLSYQDTYYSNSNSQFYWEDSEIHGTVDYLCGGGDVYYNGCTFVNESRSADGKTGSDVITAPYTDASNKFGYVFNNCTIENRAASFSFGRSWGGNSTSVWLNTTINQPKEIINTRFTLTGMNVAAYMFKEYNSMDKDGNVVSPASLVETFEKGSQKFTYDIILTDEEAAAFALDKVFTNWAPAEKTKQANTPNYVNLDGTELTWEANSDVKLWAVVKDGSVLAFTTTPAYTVDDAKATYAVRALNAMGGLSEAIKANDYITVTLAEVGYATFYDSEKTYKLPETLKAYAVSKATTSELTYTDIEGYIPAGTAVMLESVDKTGGEFTLSVSDAKAAYKGANLLKGSDVTTTTTADEPSLFYKLTYGHSESAQAGRFGWFWGAADGAAFQIEGHHAWLAIPQEQAASVCAYIIGGGGNGTTAIRNIDAVQNTTDVYYNLQGQRVNAPNKGLYIHNNKKVIIK